MRVFLDTKVLVSAFATRGLCADVLRLILTEHDLYTSDLVIAELRRVLREKMSVSPSIIDEIEEMLRRQEIVSGDVDRVAVEVRDASDEQILADAIGGNASVFVTGDRDLLDIASSVHAIAIVSPREFWEKQRSA